MNASRDDLLATYTIYRNPGGGFAIRQWLIGVQLANGVHTHVPQPGWLDVADTIEQARDMVPPRADYCMPRKDTDDPYIVETWL